MTGLTNHYRERMVACLLAQSNQPALLAYVGEAEAAAIREHAAALLALPDAERAEAVAEQRESLRTAEEVVLLGEIHPSWLLEAMQQESPRVIGLLLRFLPSRHTRYILEHLPTARREALPDVVDAFAVSDRIVRIVRRWFEAHFVPVRPASQVEQLDLHTLYALGIDELQQVIHALGVEELAMAFAQLPKSAQRVILNRLPFEEARQLMGRLNALAKVDPAVAQDARYTVMEVAIDRREPTALIAEVGIAALGKTFTRDALGAMPLLRQKLPPRLAYLLQRDVESHVAMATSPQTVVRQRILIERLQGLIASGHLDASWAGRIPEVTPTDRLPGGEKGDFEKAV